MMAPAYEPALQALLAMDVRGERGPIVAPTLYVALYLDPVQPAEVLDFVGRARRALGSTLRFYQTESMKDPAPIDEARIEQRLQKMLAPARRRCTHLMMFNELGDDGVSSPFVRMDVISNRVEPLSETERRRDEERGVAQHFGTVPLFAGGFLLAGFPLNHPIAEPAAFVEWVSGLEAVRGGRFIYGCAGIALALAVQVFGDDSVHQEEMTKGLLARHPGLDLCPNFGQRSLSLDVDGQVHPRVRRPAWLTILPDAAVRELGGLARVESGLAGTRAQIHRTAGGVVMIQASPLPRIGDVTQGDRVPEYVAVGRLLKPIRSSEISIGELSYSSEWGERWHAALDGDEPA
jgi:hypothetical protein